MFLTKSVCTIYVRKVISTTSRERTHVYGKGEKIYLLYLSRHIPDIYIIKTKSAAPAIQYIIGINT